MLATFILELLNFRIFIFSILEDSLLASFLLVEICVCHHPREPTSLPLYF